MATTKVFRMELTGGKNVSEGFLAIRNSSRDTAAEVLKLKDAIAQAGGPELKGLLDQLKLLQAAQKTSAAATNQAAKEMKDQATVEKALAQAKKEEALAEKAQEQAALARTQALIAQDKELDRQVAQEQKATKAIQDQKKYLDSLPGSYNAVKAALNELRPLIQAANEGSTISFSGGQVNFGQAIEQYKLLSSQEQAFRRQFQQDGTLVGEYTTGIVNAFKKLGADDILTGGIDRAKQQLLALNEQTDKLVAEFRAASTSGSADLNKLEKELHDNVNESVKLNAQIEQAQVELRGIGGIGSQVTSSLKEGFQGLKENITQVALGFIGFQAAFAGIQSGVETAKELSDGVTALQVELGKAGTPAQTLVDQLAKLDTRTKLTGLVDLANIAAKAGVESGNLVGVVQALDQIKGAFGKDFGDVEAGTETLVKLINVYEGAGNVTGENLLKTGNSIRTLANESVASVPFLTDFAQRLAGLKGISDISLPSVLGLASGFENFGQSAEVSSSALVKIIPAISKNVDKFAQVAGISKEAFSTLINNNPAEALIKVAEGLTKGKGSVEEISAALADANLGAGRISSILGVLGKNGDTFRKSIDSANSSFQSTGELTDAFAQKNNNLAAQLDKISKSFSDAANSKVFQTTLSVIATIIAGLIANLPAIVTLLGILSVAWAVNNAALIQVNLQMLYYNARILINRVAIAGLTIAQALNTAATTALSLAYRAAGAAAEFFGVAVKLGSGPLGIILALLGILVAALAGFSRALGTSIDQFSLQNETLRQTRDIAKQAADAIGDQKAKLAGLAAIVSDVTISEQTRLKALQDLIKINPAFTAALQGNRIDLEALNKVLKDYNAELLRKAELEAAQANQAAQFKNLVGLQQLKQQLEVAKALKTGFGDLTDEQQKLFGNKTSVGRTAFTSSIINSKISDSDFQEVFKDLNGQINKQLTAVDAAQNILKQKYVAAADTVTAGGAQLKKAADGTQYDVDIQKLKDQIEQLDKQIGSFKGTEKDLSALIATRKKLQAELDRLLQQGAGSGRGSRLTGDQKDLFKDIDAQRDRELAAEERFHLAGGDSEKDYLQELAAINTDADNKKIARLTGKNAEERKLIEQFNLDKIKIETDLNKKLFDLDNAELEGTLKNQNALAKLRLDTQNSDPNLSNAAKLQNEEDYLDQTLKNQVKFNGDQSGLEQLYKIHSIKNEQDRAVAITKILDELQLKRRGILAAQLADIEDAGQKQATEVRTNLGKQIQDILNQDLGPTETARQIAAAQKAAEQGLLATQVATDRLQVAALKSHLDDKLASQKAYYDAVAKMQTDQAALDQLTTNQTTTAIKKLQLAASEFANTFAKNVLGIKQYTKDAEGESQKVADVVDAVQKDINQTASTLEQAYFANQANQIAAEEKAQTAFLDRQEARAKSVAQSQEEQDTITRQYDQKRQAVEKKAAEQKKKLALQQATIDFALAAIKTYATYGFPLGLIAVAGLAVVYAAQRAAISAQQFAKGGKVGHPGNGKITAPQNIPAQRNGDNVLATVRRGEVILNERQQSALGGARTFRAIGVPGFADGGQLGTSLQAPTFGTPFSANSVAAGQQDLADLKDMVRTVAGLVYASDSKEVTVRSGSITKAQKRQEKDISVAAI